MHPAVPRLLRAHVDDVGPAVLSQLRELVTTKHRALPDAWAVHTVTHELLALGEDALQEQLEEAAALCTGALPRRALVDVLVPAAATTLPSEVDVLDAQLAPGAASAARSEHDVKGVVRERLFGPAVTEDAHGGNGARGA